MAGSDFYNILGVSPSASAEQIKSAYRELVKKHHPDLFSTQADKARASEKLQQINEAYAVLANTARRREYDEKRVQTAATFKTTTATKRATTSKTTTTSSRRRPRGTQKKIAERRKTPRWVKLTGCVLAVAIVAFFAYDARNEPQSEIAWTLWGNTVVESSTGASGLKSATGEWSQLGGYSSRAQCAEVLKKMVKRDEQEGSKAIFDEGGGTVGITVYIPKEATRTQGPFEAQVKGAAPDKVEEAFSDEQQLRKQQAGDQAKKSATVSDIIKRVRNYECRARQVRKPEHWLRRTLQAVGLMR